MEAGDSAKGPAMDPAEVTPKEAPDTSVPSTVGFLINVFLTLSIAWNIRIFRKKT